MVFRQIVCYNKRNGIKAEKRGKIMNIKKLSIILFSVLFIVGGCGKKTAPEAPAASQPPAQSTVPTLQQQDGALASPDASTSPQESETPAVTPPPATPQPTSAPAASSLEEIANMALSGVETPQYEVLPIDADSFESYFFVPYVDGATAVTADALITSQAHSVCLVSLPAGVDVKSFAAQVKQNADPRKWICTEAESVQVATKGNVVLLVMSDSATANAIVANFNK